jgi:GMP synthase-like glutamine amidotransferase
VHLTFSLLSDDLMPPVVACLHYLNDVYTGHAGAVLSEAGIALDNRHLLVGDPLPALDEIDGVVAFGGDQSVTRIFEDGLLRASAEFLRDCVARGVPVFGVCLGAQLLAHALGGSVARLPRRMVEWAPLEVLPAAAGDPVAGALPDGAMALHWNEDGFLPPADGVELLARVSAGGEMFRMGDSAWGVQFHPEVDAAALDGWYAESGGRELAEAGVGEADARAADARCLPGQRALSEALFGGFARVIAARTVAA